MIARFKIEGRLENQGGGMGYSGFNNKLSGYRSDIDGLRAIAVLAVVGFHAFPDFLDGGFIGVDVFFVISGFLISRIIIGGLDRNEFSFKGFYVGRIKRIFPSLLFVLAAVCLFGWIGLLADEYAAVGKHVAGGAGFVSNIILWRESGYFDAAAETKPLLHLWSLGVEEQFYLIWPLLVWGLYKLKVKLITAFILVAVVSFVCGVLSVEHDPAAAFYLPHVRFWELIAGGILACLSMGKPEIEALSSRGERDAVSMFGAALIFYGFFAISKDRLFPGFWALLPVLGAVMVISAGPGSWFNRKILSSRLLVWFGLISFPLYLWHWPLLSISQIVVGETPSLEVRVCAVIAAVILAWLTYRLIEKPIRFGMAGAGPVKFLVVSAFLVGMIGGGIYIGDGLVFRYAANSLSRFDGDVGREALMSYITEKYPRCINKELLSLAASDKLYGNRCFQSKQKAEVDVMIIGDSHAEHLFPGIAERLDDLNVGVFVQGGVPSVSDKLFSDALKIINEDRAIGKVVLSAYWSQKISSSTFSDGEWLKKTLRELIGKRKNVYVIDDVPSYSFDPKLCKFQRPIFASKELCDQTLSGYVDKKQAYIFSIKKALSEVGGAKLISVDRHFCDKYKCSMIYDGKILYRDNHHLNVQGSLYLGGLIYSELLDGP